MSDWENVYHGEQITFTHGGVEYVATIERDDFMGAPWEEHDGHGSVSGWVTRDKMPGELILSEDGNLRRYYDFAEACQIARRDGWGYMPPVTVERRANGGMTGAALPTYRSGEFSIVSDDPDCARAELFEMHKQSMTSRQMAALAARADFENLRDWCNDEWFWCSVTIRRAGDCSYCGDTASLCGIESTAGEYLHTVAVELISELGA